MKSHHSNYFSRAVLLFFSLLLLCHTSKGQSNDTTKVGVFITSIYDLDYSNNSFSVDFWIWRINTNREFKDYYSFSASNAKESKKISSSTDFPDQNENILPTLKGDTTFWDYENFSTVVKHEFNITKYPFDEEILVIEFEGENYYDDWVKLQIDEKESGYADLKINGWEIGKMRIEKFNTTYPTNFGSPGDKGSHTYSGFKILIPIKREGTALFFKLFSGLLVAFVIALFSLRINIAEADGRFGVCVGALFAALANMYIVNSNLPLVSKFTFMDKAHVLTIVLILALFIASTFSLQFYKTGELGKSKKIDKIVTYSVIAVYIVGILIIWP